MVVNCCLVGGLHTPSEDLRSPCEDLRSPSASSLDH